MRRVLAVAKLMTQRGGMMLNSVVIIYLGASRFQEHMADRGVHISILPVMALLVCAAFTIGFLEWRLGFFEREVGWQWKHMQKGEGE